MAKLVSTQATVSRYLTPEIIKTTSSLEFIARQVVEGFMTGLHKSPHHGTSIEFAEYRKYVPGDPPNFIDWKAYARMDRYYIKVFHEETNLAATLLIDGSASMDQPQSKAISKFEYARYLAASFAYLLTRQQDAVALSVTRGKDEISLPPRSGQVALNEMFGVMEKAEPAGECSIAESMHKLAEARKKRGLFFIFSDLFEDQEAVKSALGHLRFKGHEVVIFHLLTPEEMEFPYDGMLDFQDSETGERMPLEAGFGKNEYLEKLEAFIEGYREFASGSQIDYQLARTDAVLDKTFASYLLERRRVK